jgi:uncharacterized protein (DUF488 family)
MRKPTLFTIGHSTRPLAELLDLLREVGVEQLVDVRSVPRSRHNPQFEAEALARSLPAAGVAYRHAARLGGFRRPRRDSPNAGWEHPSFRGYADYMGSADFGAALEQLQRDGRERPTCVMCAEAQWWRCHRRLIADALVVRGWRVAHLGLGAASIDHELTPFAVVDGSSITYPPGEQALPIG